MKKSKMQVLIDLEPGGTKRFKLITASPADTDRALRCIEMVRDAVELLESALHRAYEQLEQKESAGATTPGTGL
jgi:hypothetical protein